MSRQGRRYIRSILIAAFSLAALVWTAVDQFGVERKEMLDLFLTTGAVVLIIIVLSGSFAALWVVLRRFRGGSGG